MDPTDFDTTMIKFEPINFNKDFPLPSTMLNREKCIEINFGPTELDFQFDSLGKFYTPGATYAPLMIYFNMDNPIFVNLYQHLQSIDSYFMEENNKEKLLGSNASKYEYNPCIRIRENEHSDFIKPYFCPKISFSRTKFFADNKKISYSELKQYHKKGFLFKITFCHESVWATKQQYAVRTVIQKFEITTNDLPHHIPTFSLPDIKKRYNDLIKEKTTDIKSKICIEL